MDWDAVIYNVHTTMASRGEGLPVSLSKWKTDLAHYTLLDNVLTYIGKLGVKVSEIPFHDIDVNQLMPFFYRKIYSAEIYTTAFFDGV